MEVEDSSGDQCKELKGIYKLLVGYVGDLHTYTNKYQYTDQQIIPFWEVDRHVSRLISVANPINLWLPGCTGTQFLSCFLTNGGWWLGLGNSNFIKFMYSIQKCLLRERVGNQPPVPWCYMPVVIVNIFWYDSHLVTIQSDLIQILPLKCIRNQHKSFWKRTV